MKAKNWVKYIIYLITITVLLILATALSNYYYELYLRYFSVQPLWLILHLLLGMSVGVILGMDHFIQEIGKTGKLHLNIPKLIIMVIPALYLSLAHIMMYVNLPFIQNVLYYPLRYLIGSESIILIGQIILGYSLITSIYKNDAEIVKS